jgi:putative inorganic carbon (HCO3(-)) transporter
MIKKQEKEIDIRNKSWIDWVQAVLIVLTAPFFVFPSMRFVWILLVVPSILICRWSIKKKFFEKTIIDWPIAILFIQVFATCLIVPDIAFSLPKIAGVLFGFSFFYATVALLNTEKLIKWGVITFIGSGFMLSIIGITGTMWKSYIISPQYFNRIVIKIEKFIPQLKWNFPGAEEGFNPNPLGGTLILIIPLILSLFFLFFNKKQEDNIIFNKTIILTFLIIALFVMGIVLILTQSVGSWIAITISTWFLLLNWKWKKWSFALIVLFIGFLFFSGPNRINLIKDLTIKEHVKIKILKREPLWVAGINTIQKYPFFGIGMNRLRLDSSMAYSDAHAHNHFIHTASELGIPGLIAYLAILIGAGFMCFEIWRKSKIVWMRMAALGLGCGQLAHFIFGMADSIPLGAKVGIFFWFSLALIAAMYNYMLKKDEDLNLKQKSS